jgi:hypothetical protein
VAIVTEAEETTALKKIQEDKTRIRNLAETTLLRRLNPVKVLNSKYQDGHIPDDQLRKLDVQTQSSTHSAPHSATHSRAHASTQRDHKPIDYDVIIYNMVEMYNWLDSIITDEMKEIHRRVASNIRQEE